MFYWLDGPSSQALLEAVVPVVDNESCAKSYKTKGNTILPSQLCAGNRTGGVDACQVISKPFVNFLFNYMTILN